MGKKSKSKTAQKRAAKKLLKKQGKRADIKSASKLAGDAKKQGLDLTQLASSAVGSIPFVGGLASNLIDQVAGGAEIIPGIDGGQPSTGRGGTRGVMLVDSRLGNLGMISRRKALAVLMNRGKRPPVRRMKQVAVIRSGEQVVKI